MDINYIPIEEADMSARSTNALHRAEIHTIGDMLKLTEDSLGNIKNLGKKSIGEILDRIEYYKQLCTMSKSAEALKVEEKEDLPENRKIIADFLSVSELLTNMSYRNKVLDYVRINNIAVTDMCLSNRSVKQLLANEYKYMSDIIALSPKELNDIPHLGSNSVKEISESIKRYISKHEQRIKLFVNGDVTAALSESKLRKIIKEIFDKIGFEGLSLNELISKIALPVEIP